jgi:5-methyltetrahydrofolate--homocysteine methyltransferase
MGKIKTALESGNVLISDGAWGTFLQAKGLKAGECPELWNMDHPDEVFSISKGYIDAGSNMIETNSFGGSSIKLSHYGLADKAFMINKAAAEISRKAAGSDHYVLGSIGPTGKILMMGEITDQDLFESFGEQAAALSDGKADAIVIETMSDIEEAVQAVKAAKENTVLEIICTMTFEKTKNGDFRTMMGFSPTDMVNQLLSEGVDIIGANCGNGFKDMIGIGQTIFPETPDEMASYVHQIIDAGVNIIGGCCGTTPAHIMKLKEMVNI